MSDNQEGPSTTGMSSTTGVSNATIAVLVILALVISIIGTWAVLNGVENNDSSIEGGNVGVITLSVMPTNVNSNVGKVQFEVK